MEQIVRSILTGIIENECINFFENIESIFKNAALDHSYFSSEKKYMEITDSYHPKGIVKNFIFDRINECEQFKDRINEDGSISRSILTARAIIEWFSEEEEFFINFFIKKMFRKAMVEKLISKEIHIISYLWIHESGLYERKQ